MRMPKKYIFNKNTHKKGFTLVETLVALTILLIAVLAPMRIVSQSIKAATLAREQLTAVFLAQEGVEHFLQLRDNDALSVSGGTWDWLGVGGIDGSCTNAGCSPDVVSGGEVSCSSFSNCTLYFDEDASSGAYYTYTSTGNIESRYTRVVTVTESTADEVEIVSTVSWKSDALKGDTVDVTFRTFILNQYE